MEELTDKKKAKKAKKQIPDNSTFEALLNETKEKNRQEVLKNLEKGDVLKIDTFLTDEILGFEVFTSEEKSIGTIPSKISEELELAMGQGLEPYITNYAVTQGEDGIYNCEVALALNSA